MKAEPAPLLTREQALRRLLMHTRSVGYGGQQALARASGIPQQCIAEIRNGKRPISPRLAAALGLRIVTMYEVIGEPVTLDPPIFNRPKKKHLLTNPVARPKMMPRVVNRMMD